MGMLITLLIYATIPVMILSLFRLNFLVKVYMAFLGASLICLLGMLLSSVLNFAFYNAEWLTPLKNYHFDLWSTEYLNAPDRSLGAMLFVYPYYVFADIMRYYVILSFTYTTWITWVINVFCWLLCIGHLGPMFGLKVEE